MVRGHQKIAGCAKIIQLPETVRELFVFTATGCSNPASTEPLDQCRGRLDLRGCATISPLPSDFMVVDVIKLEGLRIDTDSVFLKRQLPDTVQRSAVGKRIGDVVCYRVLGDHFILDAVITDVFEMQEWGGVIFPRRHLPDDHPGQARLFGWT